MNTIRLNSTALNAVTISSIPLAVGEIISADKTPKGYEAFNAADGPFIAADGDFYVVKL